MRKVIVVFAVMAIFCGIFVPVLAEDTFVPSISYKDGPEIEDAEFEDSTGEDGTEEKVPDCLVVTSLKGAEEKTTDISQDTRDVLLNVYEELEAGDMKLELEEGYVVRELVDISWKHSECVEDNHTHEEELNKEEVTITVALNLGLSASDEILVFTFHNGQWEPIVSAVNNGDGTITCVFEHFCPVAFCVKEQKGGSETGDPAGQNLVWWIVLMAASAAAILFLAVKRRKSAR